MSRLKQLVIIFLILFMGFQAHAQWIDITGSLPGTYQSVVERQLVMIQQFCLFFLEENSVKNWKFLLTTDVGNSWKEIPGITTVGEQVHEISMVDSLNIWVIGSDKKTIYRTADGGQNWQVQFRDTTVTEFINYIEMFDLQNGISMCDGEANGAPVILKTTDGGQNWVSTVSTQQIGGRVNWGADQVDFVDMNLGYISPDSSEYAIYKTIDGGTTWTKTAFVSSGQSVKLLKFGDENVGFSSTSGSLQRTVDGGDSWQEYAYDEAYTRWDIQFAPGNSSELWLVGDEGMYYSKDTGTTFYSVDVTGFGLSKSNEGRALIIGSVLNGILFSQTAVYRTTEGAGTTAVDDDRDEAMPQNFTLQQNYPNPFNPGTDIGYSLSRSEQVKLVVYNLLGKQIATLEDRIKPAGIHKIKWLAVDQCGSPLPSGVYIYQLHAGDTYIQKKMILMR